MAFDSCSCAALRNRPAISTPGGNLMPTASHLLLSESEWRDRQREHEHRVRAWTDPYQRQIAQGMKHPVYDFLFTYYAFRPAWLRRWHPGPGVVLVGDGAREFLRWPEYAKVATEPGEEKGREVALDPASLPAHRREFVTWLCDLLHAMQTRPAFFGCYGFHEWAMVYRQDPADTRHPRWPLRYQREELAQIVEGASVCCSHFDAFRFFTPAARPLNKLQPTRTDTAQLEQRGCLHANMDLYKWAFKLAPYTPSELVADCFELARDIREVDMRASPYDLRALGFEPIAVETTAGRIDYEAHQRDFTLRGDPLRQRLKEICEWLLGEGAT